MPALWTPEEITTQAWYDASDASTITKVGASAVSQWDDKLSLIHISEPTRPY